MSYPIREVARATARDATFFARCLGKQAAGRRRKSFVICNSVPKSGTHLLYQILYSVPGSRRWEDILSIQALNGLMNSPQHLRWKLGSAPDNAIIRSHLSHSEEVEQILSEHECKHVLIYRDPRDVAVSHARWVVNEPRIYLHDYYTRYLSSDEERLMATIRGVPIGQPFGSNLSSPNIGEWFSMWKGWIGHRSCLAVRFEDLVGERGGGPEEVRLVTVGRILEHVGVSMSMENVADRFGSNVLDPRESHTFQKGSKGSIGGWREHFTPEHAHAFKAIAGDLLVELGYATDTNW